MRNNEPALDNTRLEHDSLGDRQVPASSYWGISTMRAVENFPVSGRTIGSMESLAWLTAACRQLRTHCVDGIKANTAVLQQRMLETVTVVTGLAPLIGYAAAAELSKEALRTNRSIAALVAERGLLDEQKLAHALSPGSLAGLI